MSTALGGYPPLLSADEVRYARRQRLLADPPTFDQLARQLNAMPVTVIRAVYGRGVSYASVTGPGPLKPGRRRRRMTAKEIKKMQDLRRKRWSLRKIAKELKTTATTVHTHTRDLDLAV